MNCQKYDLDTRPSGCRKRRGTDVLAQGHKHLPPANPRMTRARKRVLDYVIAYTGQHGMAPSLREVGEAVGLLSSSTVWTHLQSLVKMGELEHQRNSPRSYRLPAVSRPSVEVLQAELREALAQAEMAFQRGYEAGWAACGVKL